MRLNNLSLGLTASSLGAALLISSLSMPVLPHIGFGAGLFPGIIGGGMVFVGLLIAFSRHDEPTALFTAPDWVRHSEGRRGVLLVLGLLASYFLLAETVGFIPMAVIILAILLLHKGVRLRSALVIAVTMAFAIEQFFGGVLSVPLPWGLLEPYAGALSWK